jgi:RHS repeat-associated protein
MKIGIENDFWTAEYYEATVVSANDYYPFGSAMAGRKFSSGAYRYGFNGMEKDDEVKGEGNSYDFGARLYDSRVGRWLAVDPVIHAWQSSFSAMDNNPILKIDPNGETAIVTIKGNKVTVTANFNFYGNGIDMETAKSVAKNIENAWNDANGIVEIDGVKYEVEFKVTGTYIGGSDDAFKHAQENKEDYKQNYIRVESGEKVMEGKSKASSTSNRTGFWLTEEITSDSKTPAHEQIHGWGGISGHKFSVEKDANGNYHVGIPQDGLPEGVSPNDRVVTQFNIDQLGIPQVLEGGKTEGILGYVEGLDENIYYENRLPKYKNDQTALKYEEDALESMKKADAPPFVIKMNEDIIKEYKKIYLKMNTKFIIFIIIVIFYDNKLFAQDSLIFIYDKNTYKIEKIDDTIKIDSSFFELKQKWKNNDKKLRANLTLFLCSNDSFFIGLRVTELFKLIGEPDLLVPLGYHTYEDVGGTLIYGFLNVGYHKYLEIKYFYFEN